MLAARQRAGARHRPRARERDGVGGGERRRRHASARQHRRQYLRHRRSGRTRCDRARRSTSRAARDTVHLNLTRPRRAIARRRRSSSCSATRWRRTIPTRRSSDGPCPHGTYKWMFVPGTIVQDTGRSNDNIRVRLDSQLEVWVDSASVRSLPAGYPSPRRVVGAMCVRAGARVGRPRDARFVAAAVSHRAGCIDRVTLTLYGTQATPDIIKFLQNDSLVRMVNWIPDAVGPRSDLARALAAAVRISRALRPGARFRAASAPSAACVARASARGARPSPSIPDIRPAARSDRRG